MDLLTSGALIATTTLSIGAILLAGSSVTSLLHGRLRAANTSGIALAVCLLLAAVAASIAGTMIPTGVLVQGG